jgi:hypothetical protein
LKTRLLHVTAEGCHAHCRWVFRSGKWEAVIFDPRLAFLKGMSPPQIILELMEIEATFSWGPIEDLPAPSVI